MSECLTVKWTVLTILLCSLCLKSDVWSILYLTTKDVDLYNLCLLSFILIHLISLIFLSSCLDVLARLVLARFSPRDHMSDWPFRNFLKLSPPSRHNVNVKTVAKFLWKNVICRHDILEKLIVNDESENKNAVIELTNRYEIKRVVVFEYHSQVNEIIEREHKSLIDSLLKIINEDLKNWVQNLTAVN
jgi:hypothetical protein